MDDHMQRNLNITKHEYDIERQFYVAHLAEALKKGHKYVLTMEFVGILNDNKLDGFYRASYRDEQGREMFVYSNIFNYIKENLSYNFSYERAPWPLNITVRLQISKVSYSFFQPSGSYTFPGQPDTSGLPVFWRTCIQGHFLGLPG